MNDYIDLEDIEDIDQDNGEDVEKNNEDFSRGEFSFWFCWSTLLCNGLIGDIKLLMKITDFKFKI